MKEKKKGSDNTNLKRRSNADLTAPMSTKEKFFAALLMRSWSSLFKDVLASKYFMSIRKLELRVAGHEKVFSI